MVRRRQRDTRLRRVGPWAAVAVGLVAIGGAAWVWVLPRYVRQRAIDAARAHGVTLEVGRASVGWSHVELRDLAFSLDGVPAKATAAAASVAWSLSGAGDVSVEGVRVLSEQTPRVLADSLASWRVSHRPATANTAPTAPKRRLIAHDLVFSASETDRLTLAALELRDGALHATGVSADGKLLGTTVHLEGARASVRLTDGKLTELEVQRAVVTLPLAAAAVASESARPALEPNAPVVAAAEGPGAASWFWGRVSRAAAEVNRAAEHVDSSVEIRIDALSVVDAASGSQLGPWTLRALTSPETVALELLPNGGEGRKPLELRARIPRFAGKWNLELAVGPARFGELGVREGAFGLVDVDKAEISAKGALELDSVSRNLVADGTVSLHRFGIQKAKLADQALRDVDASLRGVVASEGLLTKWTLTGSEVQLGKLRVAIEGGFERVANDRKVWATWSVPAVDCGEALTSLPKALIPALDGLELHGSFSANGSFAVTSPMTGGEPVAPAPEVTLTMDQRCRVTRVPSSLSVTRFREPFPLRVYDPAGRPKTATFGPTTASWVPFDRISPYVVDALLTCEDAGFFTHNGFSAFAIRNALLANLKAHKFAVGASTLTMQLAKNLFLDRKKQVGRKVQEAVLTAYLEQALTKHEILELYLNIVEMGPDLYGIGPASMHWFGRPASELDAAEAMFLVSLLPSPVKRHGMFAGGAPSEGYLKYIRALLKEAHKRGHLDDEELAAALDNPLTFHKPGTPSPPPRAIGGVKVREGNPADGGKIDDPAFDTAWAPIP